MPEHGLQANECRLATSANNLTHRQTRHEKHLRFRQLSFLTPLPIMQEHLKYLKFVTIRLWLVLV